MIDAGTNSIKFIVAEATAGGGWRTLVDRAEITRLGEGLSPGGAILDSARDRAVAAIADMADEARRHGVRAIAAVGTAGLRMASNGAQVVDAVRARSGVAIEIISGDEEARLAFVAARAGLGLDQGSLVIFDTGGGSSQFTFGHDAVIDERFSVDVGAVRYTERYRLDRAVSDETLREALAAIASDLSRLDGRTPPDALAAMGGAVTNLAAVRHGLATYDPDVVQGTVLDRAEIDRQIELYRTRDADARRRIVGLQPKRAEVILAGACIVRTVMDKLGKTAAHGQRPRAAPWRAGRALRQALNRPRQRTSSTPINSGDFSMATKTPDQDRPRRSPREARGRGQGPCGAQGGQAAAPIEIAKPLSGEDIVRITQLGKGSNSIELKLSIPMSGHRATVKSIGLDPVEAQPRQAFYFDTPDLALNRAGVVLRARRIQGGRADTVVKLRPVEPDTIDPELRRSAAFKVEVDVMPGGFVCSASFKGVCTGREVQDVADGSWRCRRSCRRSSVPSSGSTHRPA